MRTVWRKLKMSKDNKKNILLAVSATILLIALLDGWSYGFFTLIRFIVSISCVYVAIMALHEGKEFLVWVLGFIAILFNPIIPVYLDREIWIVIDIIVSVFLMSTCFSLKLSN